MKQAPSGRKEFPKNGPTNCAIHGKISTPSKTGNQRMRPGDVYLAQFPFGDVPGMKLRPVLLLTGPVGSVPEVCVHLFCRSNSAAFLRCPFGSNQT